MTCTHHWQIAPPDREMPAVCKFCGATRIFHAVPIPTGKYESKMVMHAPSIYGYHPLARGSQN